MTPISCFLFLKYENKRSQSHAQRSIWTSHATFEGKKEKMKTDPETRDNDSADYLKILMQTIPIKKTTKSESHCNKRGGKGKKRPHNRRHQKVT